ncbi:predicted protein [Postia placenta Mad-698-R]|uniref:Uncharacterized protein n=1 Tax=Postia placenta MAD-698-R-SB12 TaxID=670580 RepID=A0A1X6N0Y0_9APHY|nr:hypothetical protein POSPLADRAFT_1046634 [Postia placenta MAD-698-R-SB12]EED78882.1 predicted protein [Postia placenta Mad-698-R]OSX62267.1 hypothetical protein POSPLADRAFT_1046634 [Postia placenta MAD-698-R-SB12]
MASKFPLGSMVLYRPTRHVFAVSSGSRSGAPSTKERPCVIVGFNDSKPVLAPLCGALPLAQGQAGRIPKTKMVRTDDLITPMFSIPEDGSSLTREPILFTHDPLSPKGPQFPALKPSYLWVGDGGEAVEESIVSGLTTLSPYLKLDEEELEDLKKAWDYWIKAILGLGSSSCKLDRWVNAIIAMYDLYGPFAPGEKGPMLAERAERMVARGAQPMPTRTLISMNAIPAIAEYVSLKKNASRPTYQSVNTQFAVIQSPGADAKRDSPSYAHTDQHHVTNNQRCHEDGKFANVRGLREIAKKFNAFCLIVKNDERLNYAIYVDDPVLVIKFKKSMVGFV